MALSTVNELIAVPLELDLGGTIRLMAMGVVVWGSGCGWS
jgi:hypothetical protein